MESNRFDDLTRGLTQACTRRRAMNALAAGALTLGFSSAVRAEDLVPLECRPKRCSDKAKGDKCKKDNDCCQGLRCKNKKCDWKDGHGGPGSWCKSDKDCNSKFYCKKDQCLPDECKGSAT